MGSNNEFLWEKKILEKKCLDYYKFYLKKTKKIDAVRMWLVVLLIKIINIYMNWFFEMVIHQINVVKFVTFVASPNKKSDMNSKKKKKEVKQNTDEMGENVRQDIKKLL